MPSVFQAPTRYLIKLVLTIIAMHDRSYVQYKLEFDRAIHAFIAEQDTELPFDVTCGRKSTAR